MMTMAGSGDARAPGTMDGAVRVAPPTDDGFPAFDVARVRPASLAACRDVADQLDYLVGQVQGSYQRHRTSEGLVCVRLKTRDGDVLASTQSTTEACVTHLLARAGVTE